MVINDESAVSISTEGTAAVVAFNSPSISGVDFIAAASRKIIEFIEQNRPVRVIFDFAEVKFFSSQVLGMILDVRSRLKKYNGQVLISSIDPQLHRVFRITNLDKIFSFFPDRRAALEAAG